MCGRFIIFSEAQEREIMSIVEEVNRKYGDNAMKINSEIFPTDITPAVTYVNGIRDIRLFKWGFPGYKTSPVIINARGESILEKPMFRDSFIGRRCLIPATSFFEWKKDGGKKQKYEIHSSETSLFYMAGLYKNFVDKNGQGFTGYVIITTSAGNKMSEIHERMPVMLTQKRELDLWMNTEAKDASKLTQLLCPNDNIFIEAS